MTWNQHGAKAGPTDCMCHPKCMHTTALHCAHDLSTAAAQASVVRRLAEHQLDVIISVGGGATAAAAVAPPALH